MSHFRLNTSIVTSAQRTGRLDLHGRALFTVPSDVFHRDIASYLTTLDLSENKLSTIPADIRLLTNLKEIYLDSNKLTNLPLELLELPQLKAISLENNPNLNPELKALYEKAAPIFKSRARDAVTILSWLADQVQIPASHQSQAGRYGAGGGGDLSPTNGQQQQNAYSRADYGRDSRYEDRSPVRDSRDSRYDDRSPVRDSGASYGRDNGRDNAPSAQQGGGFDPADDDEYIYAQLRARAAARAAANDAEGSNPRGSGNTRGYDDRVERQFSGREEGGRGGGRYEDASPPQQQQRLGTGDRRQGTGERRPPSNGGYGQQQQQASQQQQSEAGGATRFGSTPVGARKTASPFARDDNVKMETREQIAARERAVFTKGAEEQVAPRFGRRASGSGHGRAGSGAGTPAQREPPFGTDAPDAQPVQKRNLINFKVGAPFGTDFNRESPAVRRTTDPNAVSASGLVNPWAGDDRYEAPSSQGQRGVRMVRGNEPVRASPFGTLPKDLTAGAYTTSSASANDHVVAAAKLRREGSIGGGPAAGGASGPSSPTSAPRSNSRNAGAAIAGQGAKPFSAPFARDTDPDQPKPFARFANKNNVSSIANVFRDGSVEGSQPMSRADGYGSRPRSQVPSPQQGYRSVGGAQESDYAPARRLDDDADARYGGASNGGGNGGRGGYEYDNEPPAARGGAPASQQPYEPRYSGNSYGPKKDTRLW